MSNKSYFIKKQLLETFITSLTVSEAEAEKILIPDSPDIAQGYSAVLLSMINYGFNVGTRRDLPVSSLDKETSIRPYSMTQEMQYLRNTSNHPSRECYDLLIDALQTLNLPEIDTKSLITYIEKEKASDKSPDWKTAVWLGQWSTPEDVFENVFKQLPISVVRNVCKTIAAAELNKLNGLIRTISDCEAKLDTQEFPLNAGTPDFLFDASHQPHLEASIVMPTSKNTPDISSESKLMDKTEDLSLKSTAENQPVELVQPKLSNFSTFMQKRLWIVKEIRAQLQKVGLYDLLPVDTAQTGYPCLIFDLTKFFKKFGLEQKPKSDMSFKIKNLNKCIMSYFCGLINYFSMMRYGVHFVWVQFQGSFGSLRPTLIDTGSTFRFSPGVVPDDFAYVMAAAYQVLTNELQNEEAIKKLKVMLDEKKKNKSWLALFCSPHATESQQIKSLKEAAITQPKGSFLRFITPSLNITKKNKNQPNLNEQIRFEKRTKIFDQAQRRILSSKPQTDFQPAIIASEFIAFHHQLIALARKHLAQPIANYSLSKFEGHLRNVIEDILKFYDPKETDYSQIVNSIETLLRLLKIKYELDIVCKREKRHTQEAKHTLEAGALCREQSLLSAPQQYSLTTPTRSILCTQSQDEPVATSTDSTLSVLPQHSLAPATSTESTLSQGTSATRSGMNALSLAVISSSKALSEMPKTHPEMPQLLLSKEELYFEISPRIFDEIIVHFKQFNVTGIKSIPLQSAINDHASKDLKTGTIHLMDVAAFPDALNSKASAWKEDWVHIADSNRPLILIADITSGTQEDLNHLYDSFHKQSESDQKPYILMTNASDHKFGQIGVDLVCMGELRVYVKKPTDPKLQTIVQALKNNIDDVLKSICDQAPQTTTAAKAYRKLIRDLDQRRSLRDRIHLNAEAKRMVQNDDVPNHHDRDEQLIFALTHAHERLNSFIEKIEQKLQQDIKPDQFIVDYQEGKIADLLTHLDQDEIGQLKGVIDDIAAIEEAIAKIPPPEIFDATKLGRVSVLEEKIHDPKSATQETLAGQRYSLFPSKSFAFHDPSYDPYDDCCPIF